MSEPPRSEVRTFVVRLWREPRSREGEEWEWRGEVRDVATSRRRFFRRLRGMVRAVVELLEGRGRSWPPE